MPSSGAPKATTIFRRYFYVATAADGLCAGGLHAGPGCRGRVFGTTACLDLPAASPPCHAGLAQSLAIENPESVATFGTPIVVRLMRSLSLRLRLDRPAVHRHPGRMRRRGDVSGQRLGDLIVVGHSHP